MHFPKRTFDKPIPISPLIALDRERCILCYRCTRFSENVSEDGQLVAVNRGASSYIATFEDEPYRAHFSGNVIELCPVGALTSTTYRFRARPWEIQNVPTVCGLCPVGCNIWATTREGKVARILSRNHPEVARGLALRQGPLRVRPPARRGPDPRRRSSACAGAASRRSPTRRRSTPPRPGSARPTARSSSPSPAARRSSRRPRSPASSARGSAPTRRSCRTTGSRPRRLPRAALGDPGRRRLPRARRRPGRSSGRRSSTSGCARPGAAAAEVITVNPAGDVAGRARARRRRSAPRSGRAPRSRRAARDRQRVRGGRPRRARLVGGRPDRRPPRRRARQRPRARRRGAHVAVYALPRTPNGRGVAQAWYAPARAAPTRRPRARSAR